MAEDKKHWYKNPNTTWNYRRKMSKWHFDTTLDDTNYEGIKMNFVRFQGDWSDELDRSQFKEQPPMDLSEYLVRMAIQEMIANRQQCIAFAARNICCLCLFYFLHFP